MPDYLNSTEATALLGVSRATLYAYVSRGLLHAHAADTPRESRYLREEVEQLARQRGQGRKPREVAQAALNWGLPVLESSITLIEQGRLYYRGEDAVDWARSHTLEETAALLWQYPADAAFAAHAVEAAPVLPDLQQRMAGQPCENTLLALFTVASDDAATAAWQQSPERLAAGCGALLRLLAACLLGTAPDKTPIHLQCAQAWALDAQGADLVRMALVLCADHELNASGFTARCVASTGASLRAAVVGGLAALTGGRHGGTTARVEALWDELGEAQAPARLRQRLARGETLPGFGHHLYPEGDVRAALLLEMLPRQGPAAALAAEVMALTGLAPSVDFALVALRRHLQLPAGSAFGLFALGRCAGWLAQALEQRATRQIIRPRAAYTGLRPAGLARN
ncbi:citrate synthase family protein [Delftia acidovorans]|uniref:citrate synthase family protein n=1 Tax=Delftia TaxID=80865 RepID=UPI0005054F93|nr:MULTISPECIES: citrate synthase family protein [Delftia]KFJ11846.1 citrate synthase family protein [Delftia acidovorans]PIF36617.1 citrate synthase [Burkholderiales bacterium 23]PIF68202.1 citrate synthase [Delftia sp. 60]QQB48635.1 citrate synthase family protein [Delftia acidovorans]